MDQDHEMENWPSAEEQAALFAEMRADYAAGKREDAHACETDAFQRILDGKAQAPVARRANDKSIDR
jgi:hypothetical protein